MDQQPLLTKTTLFEARAGGYHQYRIPGLLVTPAGTLLACTEARQADRTGGSIGHGDYVDIDIVVRRSLDGGLTWDAPRAIIKHEAYGPGPCHNFCPIADRDEKCIHALFSYDYARAFYTRSDDDGITWSPPREITSTYEPFRQRFYWSVLSSGLGHSIQLPSGRLIVPVWISDGPRPQHGPGRAAHLYSDDHGQSWQAGDLVPDTYASCNEAQAIELSDGRVLLNMRSQSPAYRRVVTTSLDGTGSWSTPRLDPALADPRCCASICRFSTWRDGSRDRVLFVHPDSLEPVEGNTGRARRNLTVRLSYDECQTWPVGRVLEQGPAGYSDLAVLPDKTIVCLYETGWFPSMYEPRSLTLARFALEWLTEGRDRT